MKNRSSIFIARLKNGLTKNNYDGKPEKSPPARIRCVAGLAAPTACPDYTTV